MGKDVIGAPHGVALHPPLGPSAPSALSHSLWSGTSSKTKSRHLFLGPRDLPASSLANWWALDSSLF
eukprot:964305-Alexandrium_andersonii.AAC.1